MDGSMFDGLGKTLIILAIFLFVVGAIIGFVASKVF